MRMFYLLCLILFLPLSAFADVKDCLDESGEANYVHCTYVTGLKSDDLNEGRYLKYELEHDAKKASFTFCANNTTVTVIDPIDADLLLGETSQKVSICADKRGKNCELISNNTIKITQQDSFYIAEPKLIELALAKYTNRYPHCDASVPPDGDVAITQLRMMKESMITKFKMMK